jgi:hypothetical protein
MELPAQEAKAPAVAEAVRIRMRQTYRAPAVDGVEDEDAAAGHVEAAVGGGAARQLAEAS